MKERILEFLRMENKSSAQLAEEIGVQASGISHILSGRNNPSLDFVLKMLEKYQFISTDWLLFGKGSMYRDIKMQELFNENDEIKQKSETKHTVNEVYKPELKFQDSSSNNHSDADHKKAFITSEVKKIVWFYENNSFEEYFPGK
jgi:transcriptional regulator with XRE-family HTH domain